MKNKITGQPTKKETAKEYANEHKGIYSLYKVEEVKLYFTEKESQAWKSKHM